MLTPEKLGGGEPASTHWREDFDLPKRFNGLLTPLATEALVAAVMIALVIGVRLLIGFLFGNVVPFALIFPALAGATLLAGARSGLMVIIGGQTLVWYFVLPIKGNFHFNTRADAASLVLVTLAELLLLWFVARYRRVLQNAAATEKTRAESLESRLDLLNSRMALNEQLRLQEDSLRQTRQNLAAIYDASADGLTLCRALKNDEDRIVDYWVVEVNKAHHELTGAKREEMMSAPVSRIAPPVDPRWFESADAAVKTGTMQQFDVRSPVTGRWLNIRVSPVSDTLFQQTFVDVTDRHRLDEQRQQMLKEMSHRVSNNFQMMASFLHIQAGLAEAGARAQLQTAERRVHVLAKLHTLLAYTESDREIDAGAYIAELCSQLAALIDRPDDIKLDYEIARLVLPADKIVPLGFIISELVTNAVKYAFSPPAKGLIRVHLHPTGEVWTLTVQDDGQGMTKPSDTGAKGRKGGGLGTRLVETFVNQIGGTMTTTTTGGVVHQIVFKA